MTGNHEFDAFIEAAENNPWFASLTLVERELAIQAFMFAAEIIREEPESETPLQHQLTGFFGQVAVLVLLDKE